MIPGLRRAAERAARLLSRDSAGDDEARKRVDHMREICSDVTHFLAPSQTVRDRFVAFGIPEDRIAVSPYGVDPAPFSAPARKPERPLRVGFLGSLMISKGPDVLLKAVHQLPPGSVAVEIFGGFAPYHGDDSYQRTLEPLLRHPDVTRRGPIPHEQCRKHWRPSTFWLCRPSGRRPAPLSSRRRSWPEPVIASRIGGFLELVDHGRNGFLFEPRNVNELRSLLQQLLDDPATLERQRQDRFAVRTLADDVQSIRRVTRSTWRHARRPVGTNTGQRRIVWPRSS